jgi:hypothetical protein
MKFRNLIAAPDVPLCEEGDEVASGKGSPSRRAGPWDGLALNLSR